jgi:hypothetical protein
MPKVFSRGESFSQFSRDSSLSLTFFLSTPIVNDEYLEHIRDGLITYKRCDTQKIVPSGIKIVERERGTKAGDEGKENLESADV